MGLKSTTKKGIGGEPPYKKYGNKKVEAFGKKFDSVLERDRYFFLMEAERMKIISDLKCQHRFDLYVGDMKICAYIADFSYVKNAVFIVEDTKGVLTDVFKLKRKLMKACQDLDIRIVRKPTEPI